MAVLNRPDLTREKLERTRMLMDKHAGDALVTGYEELIPGLQLPDPAPFGLEAQHPDEFVLHLLDLSPTSVIKAAETHRQSLKNPPKTIAEYLDMLERQELSQTASVLREYML